MGSRQTECPLFSLQFALHAGCQGTISLSRSEGGGKIAECLHVVPMAPGQEGEAQAKARQRVQHRGEGCESCHRDGVPQKLGVDCKSRGGELRIFSAGILGTYLILPPLQKPSPGC